MKRIIIELKEKEILFLKKLLKTGTNKARKLARANILLLANKGKQSDEIAMLLSVNRSTVAQVKKKAYTKRHHLCIGRKTKKRTAYKIHKKE